MAAVLAVALPLLVAGALAAGNTVLPRRVVDTVAVATAATVTVLCGWLLFHAGGTIVYWFGGWSPRRGLALGISFVVDRAGAGMAVLAALLAAAALVFSWRHFDAVGSLYHALMLVFLAGMVGLALTGDLFNFFVFFELMGVAAYALTGYRIEDPAPLQGALNFAVTNSVAGFTILLGIALVYARTGGLNMAQAGRALAMAPPDALVTVAFAFLLAGLLTKAAVVPFHFWLDDAHAVAPSPVCALLSGAMVQLGVYGAARIFWTVFSGAFTFNAGGVRGVLIAAGVLTAVVGAAMSLVQRHLKRLLAFSTIEHVGLIVVAVGLLTPNGLAAAMVYMLGHGMVKASLFLAAGIVLHRLGSVDEAELRGRGRSIPAVGVLFGVGGLALAALPPFGTALGATLLGSAVSDSGFGWLRAVSIFTTALTAGAVLRAGGRIFLGWGEEERPLRTEMQERELETRGPRGRTPAVMLAPAFALAVCGLLVGIAPSLSRQATEIAGRFVQRPAYEAAVLGRDSGSIHQAIATARTVPGWDGVGVVEGVVTSAGAVVVALLALSSRRADGKVRASAWRRVRPVMAMLRGFHDGHVGDYVAWQTAGLAVLTATLTLLLR
jgi:multicomponent Na+:H+ antiporter subunit D